jgi:hypothetical protein
MGRLQRILKWFLEIGKLGILSGMVIDSGGPSLENLGGPIFF